MQTAFLTDKRVSQVTKRVTLAVQNHQGGSCSQSPRKVDLVGIPNLVSRTEVEAIFQITLLPHSQLKPTHTPQKLSLDLKLVG